MPIRSLDVGQYVACPSGHVEEMLEVCGLGEIVSEIVMPERQQNRVRNNEPQPQFVRLSSNEVTSLRALVAYVAHHSGEPEIEISMRVAHHFGVENVSCLSGEQFEAALRYLVDCLDK